MLPRLSEQFHLTPADFWRLTYEELDVYIEAVERTDQHIAEQQAQYG